ncbi:OsmC family protein [Piscinibacter gummiphilus]|uniref:OsmC family protein n=1 Tax=Piscinibacter gummiphilus TaxID=946333 RepID=A0ABZ0CPH2_9BURK|nr:OsmC family protein [Piscinibacter gummiphilus]WOB06872.1 OsmC family protein [Piscinibacter gummiphilus]
MRVEAVVTSSAAGHEVTVRTDIVQQALSIPAKSSGKGSSVNGGELLMLALATCYWNDLYREAQRLGIEITSASVEASAEFLGVGLAATNIKYRAKVVSSATPSAVEQLLRETDAVAEIHNTLRGGGQVESSFTKDQ